MSATSIPFSESIRLPAINLKSPRPLLANPKSSSRSRSSLLEKATTKTSKRQNLNVFSGLDANNIRIAPDNYNYYNSCRSHRKDKDRNPNEVNEDRSNEKKHFKKPLIQLENGVSDYESHMSIASHNHHYDPHLKKKFQMHQENIILKRIEKCKTIEDWGYDDFDQERSGVAFQTFDMSNVPVKPKGGVNMTLAKLIEKSVLKKKGKKFLFYQSAPVLSSSVMQLHLPARLAETANDYLSDECNTNEFQKPETSDLPKRTIIRRIMERASRDDHSSQQELPKSKKEKSNRPQTFAGRKKDSSDGNMAVRNIKTTAGNLGNELKLDLFENQEELCSPWL